MFFYNQFPIHDGPVTLDIPPPYLNEIKNLKDLKEAESTVGKGSGMFVRYVPLSTHHMTTPDRPASHNDQNSPSL